jgi:hypothetical protein
MLDFFLRPLRSALGLAEQEISEPIVDTEREILGAVEAIHEATESIERHVEVIESLATSVGPLTESVNQLTSTMNDLVTMLAPMGRAEQGVEHASHEVRHFLRFRRHRSAPPPDGPSQPPAADTDV